MSIKRSLSLAERLEFYSIPEPNSGCMLWSGGLFRGTGYGRMSWHGRVHLVHRLSWRAHRGEIPKGLFVCHKCDVPSCINPDHLWLGTHAENMADRNKKGRASRMKGEASPQAKITESTAISIRSDRRPAAIVAAQHGLARDTVYHIRSGITWKHLNV